MLLIGKPSISMGHLYHGYVSHNQRVSSMMQMSSLASNWASDHAIHQSTGVPFKKSHGRRYDYH